MVDFDSLKEERDVLLAVKRQKMAIDEKLKELTNDLNKEKLALKRKIYNLDTLYYINVADFLRTNIVGAVVKHQSSSARSSCFEITFADPRVTQFVAKSNADVELNVNAACMFYVRSGLLNHSHWGYFYLLKEFKKFKLKTTKESCESFYNYFILNNNKSNRFEAPITLADVEGAFELI